jgi:mersacidin/lichenicidin family type 2 lantibiotic
MSNLDIIRAWKDEEFRRNLTDEQRAQLPGHPSGAIEIEDPDIWDSTGVVGMRTFCFCRTTTR